jgi:hypothetical protein
LYRQTFHFKKSDSIFKEGLGVGGGENHEARPAGAKKYFADDVERDLTARPCPRILLPPPRFFHAPFFFDSVATFWDVVATFVATFFISLVQPMTPIQRARQQQMHKIDRTHRDLFDGTEMVLKPVDLQIDHQFVPLLPHFFPFLKKGGIL